MCQEHTTESVDGPPNVRRGARQRPWKPAEARQAVVRAVVERCHAVHRPCDADALSDAVLVASELTTNAMLHGGGVTDFRVDVVGPDVRVSVSDRSDEPPVVVPPTDRRGRRRPGGHGWPIVCRLSCAVHVACLPSGGKRITAVVPLF